MFKVSIVVKGVEKKLAEMEYTVTEQVANFDDIEYLAKNNDLLVLYLPEELVDEPVKMKNLAKICKTVAGCGKPMLVIGEYNHHEEFLRLIPEIKVFTWVDRPVNLDKFEALVEKTIKNAKDSSLEAGRKKRILIVDDDPYYAKMVREWIREFYRADVVLAGMQAISYLLKVTEDDKVDLILLDYEMPVVDGPQVLQLLRQEPATAHIPVIFLTGVGTKEAVTRVMALKPDGYILKNTSKENLLEYLKGKLEQH